MTCIKFLKINKQNKNTQKTKTGNTLMLLYHIPLSWEWSNNSSTLLTLFLTRSVARPDSRASLRRTRNFSASPIDGVSCNQKKLPWENQNVELDSIEAPKKILPCRKGYHSKWCRPMALASTNKKNKTKHLEQCSKNS